MAAVARASSPPTPRPRPTPRQQVADAALAIGLAAISIGIVWSHRRLPWPAYTLALAHTAPLALRRRAPVRAVLVALSAAVAFATIGYPMVGLGPAGAVWLYSIGAEVDRPRSLLLLAAAEAALVFVILAGDQGDLSTLIGDAIVLAVAFLLGDSARRRRDLLELHRERADQLERTQAEVARRAVAEERLRIARELHDVVAHSMSVIAVQAGTGRLAIDVDPSQARDALARIEENSRAALAEMRRLLGVLRDAEGDGERSPAPTLADVDDLVVDAAAAGVSVSIDVRGRRRSLPAGMELAAYRIVQEALTNVARHAPGATARVTLEYRREGLRVEVVNAEGTRRAAPSAPGAGLGILGMRERAAVYGGVVEAAPRAGGGFCVSADLRTEGAR